jgi:hypothetical protein
VKLSALPAHAGGSCLFLADFVAKNHLKLLPKSDSFALTRTSVGKGDDGAEQPGSEAAVPADAFNTTSNAPFATISGNFAVRGCVPQFGTQEQLFGIR